jgi:xanthine dehydrogenase YagT iron-sulfur-binding subunit
MPESPGAGATRRHFLQSAGALAGVPLVGTSATPAAEAATAEPPAAVAPSPGPLAVVLNVNGQRHDLQLDPRVTLLDALREGLGLMGPKKGCDRGQCGACTVLVDGRRVNACLTLAAMHDGEPITTIEGLGTPGQLHPLQAAFIEHDGFQCGYCTPGQICSGVAMLAEAKRGDASVVTVDLRRTGPAELTDDELRERMSGNLCRCGAYPNIVAALKSVTAKAAR